MFSNEKTPTQPTKIKLIDAKKPVDVNVNGGKSANQSEEKTIVRLFGSRKRKREEEPLFLYIPSSGSQAKRRKIYQEDLCTLLEETYVSSPFVTMFEKMEKMQPKVRKSMKDISLKDEMREKRFQISQQKKEELKKEMRYTILQESRENNVRYIDVVDHESREFGNNDLEIIREYVPKRVMKSSRVPNPSWVIEGEIYFAHDLSYYDGDDDEESDENAELGSSKEYGGYSTSDFTDYSDYEKSDEGPLTPVDEDYDSDLEAKELQSFLVYINETRW